MAGPSCERIRRISGGTVGSRSAGRRPIGVATLRSGAFGPHAMDYFEYCLRIMAPSTCGTATKLEAVAMITGAVSLFARNAAQPRPGSPSIFGMASPQTHPYLLAALAEPGPPAQPDLFERTIRSVLRGLLESDA